MSERTEVTPSRTTLRRFGQRDLERYQSNQFAGLEDLIALKDSYTLTILRKHNIQTVYGVAHILERDWHLPYLGLQRKQLLRLAYEEYQSAGYKKTDPPLGNRFQYKNIPALEVFDPKR